MVEYGNSQRIKEEKGERDCQVAQRGWNFSPNALIIAGILRGVFLQEDDCNKDEEEIEG